ncbi:hypothetical protein RDI58_029444 [Solanum bulbocastanum]|uniref:Protein kinase domain-containing protein n=1 Tax=Solanum bulbocastanum TaxID=147425 RepID=A0AAN8XZM0_SOLBU
MEENKSYCVTGGTGFIGSWLIKSLLQMGYKVHAAVRHPEKSSHLLKLGEDSEMLRLFKADLREEGSFDEAMRGCIGLFHVAAPMEFCPQATENVESYVEENMIEPAIQGTLNVLKSCLKSNSVLTENAAFQFAKENGIDLVSTITPTIAGPFLTPTVPSSIRVLLSPITGDPELLAILTAVNTRMGSIALAHREDICRAHIFLMENIKAEGRYICCARSWAMSEVIDHLKKKYPYPAIERVNHDGGHGSVIPSEISSKKFIDKRWIKQYVLGVGFNGPVYLATHSSANNYLEAVAVKSAVIDTDECSILCEEGQILNKLKGSPYIVRCFGEDESIEYTKWTYNLLLECANSGTLLDFILFNGRISEQMAALYAYQLLKGIGHIHNKGRLLSVDELINHPFIQNAISTPENEDNLINISSTVNDNLFGDYWISEHHLFTSTSEELKTKTRRSINNPTKKDTLETYRRHDSRKGDTYN